MRVPRLLHFGFQQRERPAHHLLLQGFRQLREPLRILGGRDRGHATRHRAKRIALLRQVHAIELQTLEQFRRKSRATRRCRIRLPSGRAGFRTEMPARPGCPRRCCAGRADGCSRRARHACRHSSGFADAPSAIRDAPADPSDPVSIETRETAIPVRASMRGFAAAAMTSGWLIPCSSGIATR